MTDYSGLPVATSVLANVGSDKILLDTAALIIKLANFLEHLVMGVRRLFPGGRGEAKIFPGDARTYFFPKKQIFLAGQGVGSKSLPCFPPLRYAFSNN